MDVTRHNADAWDREVARGNPWTVPVDADTVARARRGEWSIILTPVKPVPRAWFGELTGAEVLALAGSGGQQAPILAAAGARVTVLDNSPAQLARDREVAEREGLDLRLVQGDMADLSAFPDAAFDLIVHPCSNSFVPALDPVWREAARVLRPGAAILSGVVNPVLYLFDEKAEERGELVLRHRIPYSDLTSLTREELDARLASGEPLEFGHTLEDQLGGQLRAGLVLTDLYEDTWSEGRSPLNDYLPMFLATRAVKPRESL